MEEWRDVFGYGGVYQVSNYGEVKNTKTNKILKHFINNSGYSVTVLCLNGKKRRKLTHRLVAEAFISNPNNLPQVNHKDENKLNNFVYINVDGSVDINKSNLEWCSVKYNQNYGTIKERLSKSQDSKKRAVLQYNKQMLLLNEYESIAEAAKSVSVAFQNIYSCCKGKIKSCKGYIWRYK